MSTTQTVPPDSDPTEGPPDRPLPPAPSPWRRRATIGGYIAMALVVVAVLVRFGGGTARVPRDLPSVPRGARWDWDFFFALVPPFLSALWITVQATLAGFMVAVLLGFLLALARRSRIKLLSWPTAFIIEFIRSTPLLIQLFFLFYALPEATDIAWSPMVTLIIGLGVHYATYCSEAYRAGINSVPKGQWEAATALNLGPLTKWTQVIIPQAVPNALPALGNYLVAGFKDAPLGATIQVTGVLFYAQTIANRAFRPTEAFTLVGIGFLLVSIPAAFAIRRLEKRISYERIS